MVEAPLLHTGLLILTALATGTRRQATIDLKWNRVNFENCNVDFRLPSERSILDTSSRRRGYECRVVCALLGDQGGDQDELRDRVSRSRRVRSEEECPCRVRTGGLKGKFLGLHTLRHTLATSGGGWYRHAEGAAEAGSRRHQHDGQGLCRVPAWRLNDVASIADAHIKRLSAELSK